MGQEELLQSAKKGAERMLMMKWGVGGMMMMSWMVGEMILTSHFNDIECIDYY